MKILGTLELERLVREAFPAKRLFSAAAELGATAKRLPLVTFVNVTGNFEFLDAKSPAPNQSFYRVKVSP